MGRGELGDGHARCAEDGGEGPQRPGVRSRAQAAVEVLVVRKLLGSEPITNSSARRPEVSAASITRSLKVWRLRMASAPRQRASLNSAMRWSVSRSYGRLGSFLSAEEGADGDAFLIPEDVGKGEENAAGVDQVVDPAQAFAGRER